MIKALSANQKSPPKRTIDKAAEKANQEKAIILLQKVVRRYIAINKVKKKVKKVFTRVFDPVSKQYFWFNKQNGQSQWKIPRHIELFRKRDLASAYLLTKIIRGFIGRMRARKLVIEKYSRHYDSINDKFYYVNKETNQTFWKASSWLIKQNIPLSLEDQLLLQSKEKIKELENKLLLKELEIKEVRKKRYEELEPLVIKDRVINAKALQRSKDMDKWTIDELAAWFVELKLDDYIPFLYKNRVDGYLFVNLSDDDWASMGITNGFHIRKLQLIMKAYRIRYQRKKDRIDVDEDDELMSEYAPSELSEVIANEGRDDEDDDEDEEDEEEDLAEGIEEPIVLTQAQREERALDDANIKIDMLVPGDAENFPMIGDIVRVRYVCFLKSATSKDNRIVQSTKKGMNRQSVEFVIGVNQVIKGFDRAIPQMSVGERSKIIITPEYAYGTEGLFPHIPPNATLIFDLTLLGFRPRLLWAKPLIQPLGLVQKPYEPTNNIKVTKSLYNQRSAVYANDNTELSELNPEAYN